MIDAKRALKTMNKLLNGKVIIKTCDTEFLKTFIQFYKIYCGRHNMNDSKWKDSLFLKYGECTDSLLDNIDIEYVEPYVEQRRNN